MQEGNHILLRVLGKILRPVMQQGQDVVGRVPRVDAPLLEVVAVTLLT